MIWQFIDSSGIGGAETHIAVLSKALIEQGADVRIVLYERHGNNPWLKQLSAARLESIILDGTFLGLVGAVRSSNCELLHTHGYKAGILGRFASRIARIPVVSTFHSGERGPFPVCLYDWVDEWTSFLGGRIA